MDVQKIEELATNEIMSLAELKEDYYFKKIAHNKVKYYIEESIKIGEEMGQKILSTYEGKSIEDICHEKNIEIEVTTEEYKNQIVKLRGKYDEDDEKIFLYHWSMKDMEKKFRKLNLDKIFNYEKISEIQLAQGLFQYLEVEETGPVDEKLDEVLVFKMGPIKKKSSVKKTKDIANHIFCKKVLNLSFHPKVMDYFYFVGRNYIDINFLENYFKELNKILIG